MAYFKITLMRSAIGMPYKTKRALIAMGLKKRMATVFHPVNSATAGRIFQVKELVAVSEVEHPMTKAEVKAQRTPPSGFYIEKPGIGAP